MDQVAEALGSAGIGDRLFSPIPEKGDEIVVDPLAQTFHIGGVDEELVAAIRQEVERLRIDSHLGGSLPAVHPI